MPHEERPDPDFRGYAKENRAIWEANAEWWDDFLGDGNAFQTQLIEPATERLLKVHSGDRVLDVACGAGRFARRLAELGAQVVAFDHSRKFIARARKRTAPGAAIEYHVMDAGDTRKLLAFGERTFDRAVCTMALMDMPTIEPLMRCLRVLLKPGGCFVFSVTHPCFHSGTIQRFCELTEEEVGRHVVRTGVKVSAYLAPAAKRTEGIIGQPAPEYLFHRPLHVLLNCAFSAGLVADGMEEPGFSATEPRQPGVRWEDLPDIPPVLVVRMRNPAEESGAAAH